MKILCLIESLGSGGAERQMVGLATMLKQRWGNIVVAKYNEQDFYRAQLEQNNVEIINASNSTRLLFRLFGIMNTIISEKPDLIISFSRASSIMACLGKLVGLKYKLIVSERNTTQVLSKIEKLKFYLFRYSDQIIPNSYSQEKYIVSNFPRLSYKTKVICNFVETDVFVPKEKTEETGSITILVVARVSEQKNVYNFIRAIKLVNNSHKNVKVQWYGDQSHKDYFANCKSLIVDLGLTNVISFLQPSKNILKAYQNADIFCLPSVYEGYPNVICEAMSTGLPIVCSNVCDNPTIVEDGVNGLLFNPISVDDIATKICTIVNYSHKQWKSIGEINRDKMIRGNSKKEFDEKYIKIIDKICEK